MTATQTLTAVAAACPFALFGTAKLTSSAGMSERAAHLGFTNTAYKRIGALELAGVAGLLAGLAFPVLGGSASVGLLALLAGAVIAHARAGDHFQATLPALVAGGLVLLNLVALIGGW
ncbi:MAG: DoxX family protein [Nocardioides sp.]|uniref:DoxX family protein n=1 Tax=Nocardioides sp. TaxID=35761 RepID=UPI0039E30165